MSWPGWLWIMHKRLIHSHPAAPARATAAVHGTRAQLLQHRQERV